MDKKSYVWNENRGKVHIAYDGISLCLVENTGRGFDSTGSSPKGRKTCKICLRLCGEPLKKKKLAKIKRLKLKQKKQAFKQHKPQEAPRKKKKAMESSAFYTSDGWRRIRYLALKANNGMCELCGRSRKDGVILHCDHIKPRSIYPELEYKLSNLQILCEDCNLGKSNLDETDWRNH